MNLDEEAGRAEWLGPGRYVGFITSVKSSVTKTTHKPCYEFLVQCPEGQQIIRLILQGNCLWTWARLASCVGVPKVERDNSPLEYDQTDLKRLTAGGMDDEKAKKACRVVVTDEARLGWFFMSKPVGIIVELTEGKTKDFNDVKEPFRPTPEEIAAAQAGLDDDDIPF